jgi:hypothetical protein
MTRATPRALLLVLLVYVTLDLSLPGMPGAFVFDPAGSVESTSRVRESVDAPPVSLPAPDSSGRHATSEAVALLRARIEADRSTRRSEHPLPRATVARAPAHSTGASEDPH